MKTLLSYICAAACCGVLISSTSVLAQGTAFTYQGRLNSNGSAVTGQYDLKFALYTTSSGGSAAFGPITNTAAAVTNGLFTVTLDFGAGVFNGTTYWLDIAARTNGNGAFSQLNPRQQLTPSPYAVYAPSAGTAATAASVAAANIIGTISVGQLSSAVVTNNEANVTLTGTFAGSGSGLTNIPLSGLATSGSFKLATNGVGFVFAGPLIVGPTPVFVVAATNLNGAGHVDLVSANYGGNTVTVLTNNGSGQFTTETTLNLVTNPFCVAVTDVNNDGRPDLICSYLDGSFTTTNLTVFTNNGAGGFGSNATLTVGLGPSCVIAADVNGDGRKDLITANFGTNTLSILTNNGSGRFISNATVRVGLNPVEVIAADLIGNGKQDLISANLNTNTLSVLINNGNGTFLPTTYTVGNGPRSVVAFDVNGDGLLDLVCINSGDNSMTVLINNGDGTFSTANTITDLGAGADGMNNIVATDLDGDGKLDVVIANDAGLVVLLNTGNATFGPPITLLPNVPSPGFYHIAAADLNGDGKPDLVAAAYTTNVLAQIMNVTGQTSSELTLANQSGGLRLLAGLNGVPNLIGGSSANVVDPGLDGSVIAGGGSVSNYNHISASQSVIDGGEGNVIQALADHSLIGGGLQNTIRTNASYAVISGGSNNTVSASLSAINGGEGNTIQALADHSTIGGGLQNIIVTNASYAVIGGGYSNTASGYAATVPGGFLNLAGGDYSLAAGQSAQAINPGCFVWADSTGAPFPSTANDQFSVRANGGIRLVTSTTSFETPDGNLAIIADGGAPGITATGGSFPGHMRLRNAVEIWPGNGLTNGSSLKLLGTNAIFNITLDGNSGNITNSGNVYAHGVQLTSDRNAKENLAPVSSLAVLAKVSALPIAEWNYKGDPADIRHIGPIAQDFSAAFSLNGEDNRHISAGDEGGVALAAIQGLNERLDSDLKRRDVENAALKKENDSLQKRLGELERAVKALTEGSGVAR